MIDSRHAALAAFVLRVASGLLFIAHAMIKILVFTPAGTAGFFGKLGLPGGLAYVVIAAELLGGLALVLGVWARLVALALIPILLGALSVHAGNGWVFNAPNGGWEYPAFLALTAFAHVLIGDGAFAVTGSRSPAAAKPALA